MNYNHTTISVVGDSELKARMKVLASSNRTTIGKLVRDAIDAKYGNELSKIFADDDASMYQPLQTKNAQE